MIAQPMPPNPEPQRVVVAEVPDAFYDARFETLFKQYGPQIKKTLAYLSGDEVLAEEAMMDGFLELAKPAHWSKIISGSILNVRAYAMKCAENKLANSVRSYLRATAHEAELTELTELDLSALERSYSTPWHEDPERRAQVQEIRSLFRVVIPRLYDAKPTQAVTVCLRYLDEYDISEVAQALNVNQNTVRSNLRYGLKSLRELIIEFEAEVGQFHHGDPGRSIR